MPSNSRPPVESAGEPGVWRFGDIEFDELQWELRVAGTAVDIEPRPLEVLQVLLRHAGEVVSKDELIAQIYGHPHIGDGALTNAIARLRREIGDRDWSIIVTVHRVGYRFAAPVERRLPMPARPVESQPEPALKPGDGLRGRPDWRLEVALGQRAGSEVWRARQALSGELRVFKFASDGPGLQALKRELTLGRVLAEALGPREDFVPVLGWDFAQAPFYLEMPDAGLRLDDWYASRGGLLRQPLAERLELLARIAETVSAAHGVGVLHKDLKPQNVLVEAREAGRLQVRVVDFGSGRMLSEARLRELGITRQGLTLTRSIFDDSTSGTLRYLAPELLAGQPPTVQADVYAVGVLLYQFVVGDFLKVPNAGWEQGIDDPLLREDIAAAAHGDPAHRLSDIGELARRLRSLEARRRAHAEAEAARAAAEQTRRELELLRARRKGLQFAVAVLVCGLAISALLGWRILHAERRARDEAARANAVISFLNRDLLATIGDGDLPLRDLTVRQMLASAQAQVDQRFPDDPVAAARVHASLATSLLRLDQGEQAERSLDRALALYAQAEGPGSEAALRLMQPLLSVKYSLGKLDYAVTVLASTIAAGEQRLGAGHEAVLQARLELVRAEGIRGHRVSARDALRGMAEVLAAAPEPDRRALEAQVLRLLGTIEYSLADDAPAELHLRRALDITTEQFGPDHQRTAVIRAALAATLARTGKTAESEALFAACQATISRWTADDSSDLLLRTSALHAEALLERDAAAEAAAELSAAITRWLAKPRSAAERSQLHFVTGVLGRAQLRAGDLAAADQTLAEALQSVRAELPLKHPDRWVLELDAAEHRLLQRDAAAAATLLAQPAPDDLPQMRREQIQQLRLRGLLARATGDAGSSRQWLQQAREAAAAVYGPAHWQTQRLASELAGA